jgi:hypothetical protein
MKPNGFHFTCEQCNYDLCQPCVHTLANGGSEDLRVFIKHKRSSQSVESNLEDSSVEASSKQFQQASKISLDSDANRIDPDAIRLALRKACWDEIPSLPKRSSKFVVNIPSDQHFPDALLQRTQKAVALPESPESPQSPPTSVDINGEGCIEYVFPDVGKDGEFSFGMPAHLRQMPRVSAATVHVTEKNSAWWCRPAH